MKILFIGDIVGKAGREAVEKRMPAVISQSRIDFTIANAENASGGYGITPDTAENLLSLGIDCLTSGNHVWDKKESTPYLERQPRLLRPLNYPEAPGKGFYIGESPSGIPIVVLNIQGRIFMPPIDCPFRSAKRFLSQLSGKKIIVVDMHAEATSEKTALGTYLDGEVSAVIGTHTHVQTADERILPKGTAYITDVGMTGSFDSIIGMEKEKSIQRIITQQPRPIKPAKKCAGLNGVIIEIDHETGGSLSIERLSLRTRA